MHVEFEDRGPALEIPDGDLDTLREFLRPLVELVGTHPSTSAIYVYDDGSDGEVWIGLAGGPDRLIVTGHLDGTVFTVCSESSGLPPTVAIVAGQLGQIDECESVPVADALEAAAVFACDRILLDTLNWTIE